jgi:hypothetical protein
MQESPHSSSSANRLYETHARPLNTSFSTAVSQTSSQIQKPLDELSCVILQKKRLAENCLSYLHTRITGKGNVDKTVMKCLRVEGRSFIARNKMNSWYGISRSHIPMLV